MDISDVEWICGCGHTNPDYDERCNGCGQERYPEEVWTPCEELPGGYWLLDAEWPQGEARP